jgi:uncharacterized protein YciI
MSLAISNAAVLLVVWIVSRTAGKHAAIPTTFIVLELVIVVICALLCSLGALAQFFGELADNTSDDEGHPSGPAPSGSFSVWWSQNHERVQRPFVIPLAALMVIALCWLVHATGGGTSPFISLLEAPAVLGPFIAGTWIGVTLSALAVSGAVAFVILSGELNQDQHYSRAGHVAVVVFAIVVAATISAAQKFLRRHRLRQLWEEREKARHRPLFIVIFRYRKPRAEIDALLGQHDAHMARLSQNGRFSVPEARSPSGEMILARAEATEEIQAAMDEDPLVAGGAATYEIISI